MPRRPPGPVLVVPVPPAWAASILLYGSVHVEIAAAAVAGAVLVVAGIAAVVRRRRSTEAHSVAGYRQTLEVLGHLGGGDRGVRPLRERPEPPGNGALAHRPGRVAGTFDDLGTEAKPAASGGYAAAEGRLWGGTVGTSRRDRSMRAMERPARRVGLFALAVVVLLAAAAAAYLVARPHHAAPRPNRSAAASGKGQAPPPTTQPARYTAVHATGSSLTYAPSTPTYTLTVGAATADCWISVTSSAGTTLIEQTFAAGATASLSLSGRATIVIGAPQAARISISRVPVVLPGGLAGPVTVNLVPA